MLADTGGMMLVPRARGLKPGGIGCLYAALRLDDKAGSEWLRGEAKTKGCFVAALLAMTS